MFMISYGRNMSVDVMRHRCPDAVQVAPMMIRKARLVFRDVADIKIDRGDDTVVPAGLWWITDRCERDLDKYEGLGYQKIYWPKRTIRGRTGEIFLYQMITRRGIRRPEKVYVEAIARGYKDFGYGKDELKILRDAVKWAKENEQITAPLHDRYVRRGRLPRADTGECYD